MVTAALAALAAGGLVLLDGVEVEVRKEEVPDVVVDPTRCYAAIDDGAELPESWVRVEGTATALVPCEDVEAAKLIDAKDREARQAAAEAKLEDEQAELAERVAAKQELRALAVRPEVVLPCLVGEITAAGRATFGKCCPSQLQTCTCRGRCASTVEVEIAGSETWMREACAAAPDGPGCAP